MREIRFRGHTGNSWVFGNLMWFKDSSGETRAQIENTVWDDFGCWNVVPDSVGQYTGLKDKNAQNIYEGDIVPWEWGDGSVTNEVVDFEDGCFWLGDQAFLDILTWIISRGVVIGNFLENPELLK